MDAKALLKELTGQPGYRGQIVHVATTPARPAKYGRLSAPLAEPLQKALAANGIERFYTHQAEAVDAARGGRYRAVVTATPTSSGKSLAYNVPVLEAILADPRARAMYLFPTKALAQDQQRALDDLLKAGGKRGKDRLRSVRVATYDGDTPTSARGRIRREGQIVITNPDMLHVGILPNHHLWDDFFTHLRYVVVDEAHIYRGVFGSQVSNVLRRLARVCALYGAQPVYLLATATIANPAEHVARLTGQPETSVATIINDGAPSGPRTFALWNPPFIDAAKTARKSAQSEATALFTELTRRGVRNITFTRSQKQAELILRYARDAFKGPEPALVDRVAAYRAGYLPEQRRELEQALFRGDLVGVTATNALELGVDIGDLDATVHVGYPGTIASLRQQAGRAGRGTRPALSILVAQDNPLDQYFMRHPEELLGRTPENALIDPDNGYVVAPHVRCALQEGSLTTGEGVRWFGPGFEAAADGWREAGVLTLRTGRTETEDRWYYTQTDYPAQDVNMRSVGGRPIRLVDEGSGVVLEEIDAANALRRVYPGAVYLHQGESYVVKDLDLRRRVALARSEDVNYYTEAREASEVRLLEAVATQAIGQTKVHYGRAAVTQRVVSFRRLQQFSETVLDETPLALPADSFETMATWWDIPTAWMEDLRGRMRDPLAAMHAAEHAAIGILPLFAMCDRWDIGGLSINLHPDTNRPQIIIYDGYPGGVGITEKGYHILAEWWAATLKLIEECPCADGCPSCVQSPKCGNNNDRLDKDGAVILLRRLLAEIAPAQPQPGHRGLRSLLQRQR